MNQEQIEAAARAVADAVKISIRPGGETMRLLDKGHTFHLNPDEARTAARAVIAAIHPTVDSVEELDALPEGSVIRFIDITPTVAVKDDEGTWCGSHGLNYYGWYDDDPSPVPFPATVLHIGGAA